ncbi:MAG: hypothetical protein ACRDQ5_00650 [Sciscionella sp.]
MVTRRPTGPPPGGVLGWVLASDARTRRALSLLAPMCTAVIVVAVCATVVASVAIGHAPAVATEVGGGMAGLTGVAGAVSWRRWHTARARRDTRPSSVVARPTKVAGPQKDAAA